MKTELLHQSDKMNAIAIELEQALKHAKIAANHFLDSEVPRACAHTLAVQGHLAVIDELLIAVAKLHKTKSIV